MNLWIILLWIYLFDGACPVGDLLLNPKLVSCHMFSLWGVDTSLLILLSRLYPSHGVHYSTVGDDLRLERVIDCLDLRFTSRSAYALLWSVENQQITDSPIYPMYEVLEWPLSWLPPRSASHWNFSWRNWLMVFISVVPSWVTNFSQSSFANLQFFWEIRCASEQYCSRILILYHTSVVRPLLFAHSCFWSSATMRWKRYYYLDCVGKFRDRLSRVVIISFRLSQLLA